MKNSTDKKPVSAAGVFPPEDMAAEEAIIGGVLNDADAIYRIETPLEPADFYHTAHQNIYEAFLYWHEKGLHPDLVAVAGRLKDMGALDDVGGEFRLKELSDRILTSANIEAYAQMVFKKSKLRKMISCGAHMQGLGHQADKNLDELINEAESAVLAISDRINSSTSRRIGAVGETAWARILERSESGVIAGLESGFYDLDAITQGFQRGDLILWGARPAMGKTSAAVQAAKNIAAKSGQPALIFSLEMSSEQLWIRMLSSEAKIESGRIRTGRLTPPEFAEAAKAKERLEGIAIHIEEKPGITLSELRNHARKLSRKEGQLSCIVIDYLQIMGGAEDDRVQAIAKITRSLKSLARELNCPIILLSQLSRGVEARTNKRPMMSDLRDSGAIEQDADLIVMMYREEYYDPDTPDRGIAELIIVKHRNGPTGTVKLLFQPEYTLFLNRGQGYAD